MSIEVLKKNIEEIERSISEYEAKLEESPNDFAYELALSSLNSHLDDLRKQVSEAMASRSVEVIEFTLRGDIATNGSLPLKALADISKKLEAAISSASIYMRTNKNLARVGKRIRNSLGLRLAGLRAGSTSLLITANTDTDLFGESALENSLEKTFSLFQAKTSGAFEDALLSLGSGTAKKYRSLVKTLLDYHLEFGMNWTSSSNKVYCWGGSNTDLQTFSNTFDKLIDIESTYDLKCTIDAIDKKGKLRIVADGKSKVVTFIEDNLLNIRTLHIDDHVLLRIRERKITNQVTGDTRSSLVLEEILEQT